MHGKGQRTYGNLFSSLACDPCRLYKDKGLVASVYMLNYLAGLEALKKVEGEDCCPM